MSCEEYKEELIRRLYGEPEEKPGLDEHLEGCASCRADFDEFDELAQLYREASTEPMPLGLRSRALSGRSRRSWWEVSAAAGLAAALLLAFVLWSGPAEPDIPWDLIDLAALGGMVLPVTPEERADVMQFLDAPPAWEEVSFAAEDVGRLDRRLEDMEAGRIW